ncbi:hypothetical protein A6769_31510 [Nostoc punctiforme NIES-2108]|uniref:Uncharacterized protein n=1 Tax=Nostoc punctiforme NIES-2108 TaxID=1356359 RepID=A0A367R6M7_NOSPU|nr:hypothetical protein A6769_31510 [Nostoc punctiforme NIES-2108]
MGDEGEGVFCGGETAGNGDGGTAEVGGVGIGDSDARVDDCGGGVFGVGEGGSGGGGDWGIINGSQINVAGSRTTI